MNLKDLKIQIMGSGAIGSLFGGLIQLSGFDVHFVARRKRLEVLKKGLRIRGLIEADLDVDVSEKPENADITIVAVKAYDTENAAELLSKVDCGVVLTIQNGLGNVERLSRKLKRVIGGVTTYGANIKDDIVFYAGEGVTFVGNDGYISEDALLVERVLKESGFNCYAVDNISERIWRKAIVNAVINPITAILKVENGRVLDEGLWSIAKLVIEEGKQVMERLGINVDGLEEAVREVAVKTARNRSSMLQDIMAGRRTEIDYINGEIVRLSDEMGISACANLLLTNLVKAMEEK
ncbi:ketopantoate reductase [Archaeoglobus sulfaticallidus PM70-1]|uniref:2-dehydropantoate 2-reductase n=1 Tax=Archaeoglobus sulfaticallidus PM70-1 TaxID=387631 RepID=N0BFR5_9EURY|nr:2-dehydropantoate 2-reductase [Archaeoglobus sulfaticallidus]AGK61117.1 ketopantoate reductase [Archaeoglobus sulfaticallidus PM70-1]